MPVVQRRIINTDVLRVVSFVKGGHWRIVFLAISLSAGFLRAQTIQIKLVNGRNGSPFAGTCVNVWVGNERKDALAIPTDKNGIARLTLTGNDSEVDLHNIWKGCGAFGIKDPVVKFDSSLRVNAGYVLCQSQVPDYSWLATSNFSVDQVIRLGIVTPNSCGRITASPKPGDLTIFVRPLNWWEKLKQ